MPVGSLIVGQASGRVDIRYGDRSVQLLRFREAERTTWRVAIPRERLSRFLLPRPDRGLEPKLTEKRFFRALCEAVDI